MVASKIPGEIGSTQFVFLTLYRLKTLSDEEKHDWFGSWQKIRRNLPQGMKIITEASSAFGTEYTGFTVYEGPMDKFEELTDILEEHTWGFLEKSMTIIGSKGFSLHSGEFQKILEGRPVD